MEVTRVVAVGTGLYFVSSSGDLYYAATSVEPPVEPRLVAQGGPFDSDDYDSDMIVADAAHVYWISGSGLGRRASDSEGWALYKSCRVPETSRR
jgi:hypothetical protein